MKKMLFAAAFCFLSLGVQAQRSVWDGGYNRLGIKAGLNHFNIITNQLEIAPKISWTAGFTTRSSFYEDFQFIYGITFYDFRLEMEGREKIGETTPNETIPFNMIGVQGNFFGSYKILGHHLSVEAGPVVQVNGKLDARQDKELFYVGNYDVQGVDIEKISPFSVNFAVGLSGGFEALKFWGMYQHGINNILSGLNNNDLQSKDASMGDLKGHMSMISGGVVVFL